jgi:ubiquitin-like protein Pup
MGRPQSQTEKSTGVREDTDSQPARPKSKKKSGEALKKEMDAVMDEIDDVLQENAEEFVKAYVQRGGE